MDISTTTPTQILRKIDSYEIYMYIHDKDVSSSTKKKDLAVTNQEKGKARL